MIQSILDWDMEIADGGGMEKKLKFGKQKAEMAECEGVGREKPNLSESEVEMGETVVANGLGVGGYDLFFLAEGVGLRESIIWKEEG